MKTPWSWLVPVHSPCALLTTSTSPSWMTPQVLERVSCKAERLTDTLEPGSEQLVPKRGRRPVESQYGLRWHKCGAPKTDHKSNSLSGKSVGGLNSHTFYITNNKIVFLQLSQYQKPCCIKHIVLLEANYLMQTKPSLNITE